MSRYLRPRAFERKIRSVMDRWTRALEVGANPGDDARTANQLKRVVASANRRNWQTRGSSTGHNWDGQRAGNTTLNDGVDSGRLRRLATTASALQVKTTAGTLYVGVPVARVPYVRFIGSEIFGWTSSGRRSAAEVVSRRMAEVASP